MHKETLNIIFTGYILLDIVINAAYGFSFTGVRVPAYLSWLNPIIEMPFWIYNLFMTVGVVLLGISIYNIRRQLS